MLSNDPMTLDDFTDITMAVLEAQGLQTYAPTLVVQGVLQVVQGIPQDLDHREAIQQVIQRAGLEGTDLLFGVRSGPGEVTTGHQSQEGVTFQRISRQGKGYTVAPMEVCEWWTLDGRTSH